MRVWVEIKTGPGMEPDASHIQKNIDTIERVIGYGGLSAGDVQSLMDTLSILRGLQKNMT